MSDWENLFLEPPDVEGAGWEQWFTRIARQMLCGTRLWVGSQPHRFTEIEFYYYGSDHLDPFTHRDPIQKQTGHWYFHRTRGVYRGGSFKGVDLTFGGPDAFGGILIRGVGTESDDLIDGPSLTVDHLLRQTEAGGVAELDEAVGGRPAWEADNPLRVEMVPLVERNVVATARVGLTLKRLRNSPVPPSYIMRSYRFLSEPRRISKGKVHMVLALHMRGLAPEEIARQTGCPRSSVQRYITDFEAGRKETDFVPYFGIDLGTAELCRLQGLCQSKYGPPMPSGGSGGSTAKQGGLFPD